MLGEKIFDPNKTESNFTELDGLKLLPIETTFSAEKFTRKVTIGEENFIFMNEKFSAKNLDGYEIHSGVTKNLNSKILARKNILGTYVHGIFDNDKFRRDILNLIRRKRNLPPIEITRNISAEKQKNYERLAKTVRENLNMTLLKKIMQ